VDSIEHGAWSREHGAWSHGAWRNPDKSGFLPASPLRSRSGKAKPDGRSSAKSSHFTVDREMPASLNMEHVTWTTSV